MAKTSTTKTTLVQNAAGQVTRVRIGDQDMPVQHASPVVLPGKTGLQLVLTDVEIVYEVEKPVAEA